MDPVSAFLHRASIRILRYLDDWLIQAASRSQVMSALDAVLHLCQSLGIVVNWKKSHLVPAQQMIYLGILLDSQSFRASPAQERVEKLLSIGDEFLSCEEQPASSWLEPLVPGGRLRMCSLQHQLRRSWDHHNQSVLVRWTSDCQRDLAWWLVRSHLEEGVSLSQVSPNLDFWSNASDVGWGTPLGDDMASGLWSPQERDLSINARELLAVERGLLHFAPQLTNSTVAVFADNSTAVSYLHNQGGTRSPLQNSIAQRILRWAESVPLTLAPQFIMDKNNVLADALSQPNQILDSEAGSLPGSAETLAGDDRPLRHLVELPMFTVFFAIPRSECLGYGHSSSELGRLSGVCLSTLVPDTPGSEETPVILWSFDDPHCSVLASAALVPGTSGSSSGRSSSASFVSRSAQTASFLSPSSRNTQAVSSCVETPSDLPDRRGSPRLYPSR